MRLWRFTARWPSPGTRLLTCSLLKPAFPLSSGKTTMSLLEGSCATSGEQGSSPIGPGPEKREGGPRMGNSSKFLILGAPARTHSSTCSSLFQQIGVSGVIPPTPSLRGGNQGNKKGSPLFNWSRCLAGC